MNDDYRILVRDIKKAGKIILTYYIIVVILKMGDFIIQCQDMNHNFTHKIREYEIKEVLKRMNEI